MSAGANREFFPRFADLLCRVAFTLRYLCLGKHILSGCRNLSFIVLFGAFNFWIFFFLFVVFRIWLWLSIFGFSFWNCFLMKSLICPLVYYCYCCCFIAFSKIVFFYVKGVVAQQRRARSLLHTAVVVNIIANAAEIFIGPYRFRSHWFLNVCCDLHVIYMKYKFYQ